MILIPPVPAITALVVAVAVNPLIAQAPVYHHIKIKMAIVNARGTVVPLAITTVDIRLAGSDAYQPAKTTLGGELNIAIPPGRYELRCFYIHRWGNDRTMFTWDWVPFEVTGPGVFEFSNDNATEII